MKIDLYEIHQYVFRRADGNEGKFLTQISPIAQILWEDARLADSILFSLRKLCCAEGTKIAGTRSHDG